MLQIEQALYDTVLAHCRSRYPKEACGLFASVAHDGPVVEVYPMTNVEDSPIGYAMDPREQLQVEKQMRQRRQRLRGIFHSHTATEAYPSSVDVRLAISPDISYVLVSLKDHSRPAFKSYRIDGTTITEEPVRIEEVPRQARQDS
jgi:proteasome lid subunit RPN8/RPN11